MRLITRFYGIKAWNLCWNFQAALISILDLYCELDILCFSLKMRDGSLFPQFFSDTTNNFLTGDVSSPSVATFNCTFLSGFTGSAHCTVQYGTDPTYMNLPYSAESTETGTAGDTVSVVLRERLNSSTVYYYTVSAVSGDVTVIVQGNFTTPQSSICACTCQCTWKF